MYTASLQVLPLVGKKEEVSMVIDQIIDLIKESGLKFEVNAHSTVVEGEVDEILNLFRRIIEKCENLQRCVVSMQIDIKKGGVSIEDKVYKYRRSDK